MIEMTVLDVFVDSTTTVRSSSHNKVGTYCYLTCLAKTDLISSGATCVLASTLLITGIRGDLMFVADRAASSCELCYSHTK